MLAYRDILWDSSTEATGQTNTQGMHEVQKQRNAIKITICYSFTWCFYEMKWCTKTSLSFVFLEQCTWLSFLKLKRQCLIGTWSALLNKLLISNIWSHIYNFRSCRGLVWHMLYYGVYYYFLLSYQYCIVFYTPRFMLQSSGACL